MDVGADPNAEASKGCTDTSAWTPMHCVANSGWVNVAQLLLENGGSAVSRTMYSPYCWAADAYDYRFYRIPPGRGNDEGAFKILYFGRADERD